MKVTKVTIDALQKRREDRDMNAKGFKKWPGGLGFRELGTYGQVLTELRISEDKKFVWAKSGPPDTEDEDLLARINLFPGGLTNFEPGVPGRKLNEKKIRQGPTMLRIGGEVVGKCITIDGLDEITPSGIIILDPKDNQKWNGLVREAVEMAMADLAKTTKRRDE